MIEIKPFKWHHVYAWFLPNLLVGRLLGEGPTSADFQENNPRVCGNFSTFLRISSLRGLAENLALKSWDLFSTEVIMHILS